MAGGLHTGHLAPRSLASVGDLDGAACTPPWRPASAAGLPRETLPSVAAGEGGAGPHRQESCSLRTSTVLRQRVLGIPPSGLSYALLWVIDFTGGFQQVAWVDGCLCLEAHFWGRESFLPGAADSLPPAWGLCGLNARGLFPGLPPAQPPRGAFMEILTLPHKQPRGRPPLQRCCCRQTLQHPFWLKHFAPSSWKGLQGGPTSFGAGGLLRVCHGAPGAQRSALFKCQLPLCGRGENLSTGGPERGTCLH